MHSLIVYDKAVRNVIHEGFEVHRLAHDCLFTEGPVWNREGYYLFSDIPAGTIYRIAPGKEKEVFFELERPSGKDFNQDQWGSNGLAYDGDGTLLICQHGAHCVSRLNGEGYRPFITSFDQRPLNSPNDIVVHSNGTIFFSDPPYGLKGTTLDPSLFQAGSRVYYHRDGVLNVLCEEYQYPNGVCLSPDHDKLYICSSKPFENFISVYDTSTLQKIEEWKGETSDGIKCDRKGNLYLCTRSGILLLDPQGRRLCLITLPSIPANCCWGGTNGNDLLVTARENVYLITNLQKE